MSDNSMHAATYASHVREALAEASKAGLACSIRRWTPEGQISIRVDPSKVVVTPDDMTLPDGTIVVHHGPDADPALPEVVVDTEASGRMAALRAAIEDLGRRSPTGLLRIRQGSEERHVEATDVRCATSGVFIDRFAPLSSEEIDSVDVGEMSIDIHAATGQIRISL